MRKAVLSIALILWTGVTMQATMINIVSVEKSDPEALISYYIEALKKGAVEKALGVCALEEYVEHFDALAMNKRLQVLMPYKTPGPQETKAFRDIHLLERCSLYAQGMRHWYYSLFYEGEIFFSVSDEDGSVSKAFYDSIIIEQLSDLTIIKISTLDADLLLNPRYKNHLETQARLLGAEDYTERVVYYAFKNKYYKGGFSLCRYGKYWKIVDQSAPLANTEPAGVLEKISREDVISAGGKLK